MKKLKLVENFNKVEATREHNAYKHSVGRTLTIAFDGKIICSTNKMSNYDKPLHILSAYLCESGLTRAQKTADKKSNEIPAMRELIRI